MNKFLRALFVLVIIAMSGAIIFQLFFPIYMGSHSGYGVSVGWQREIGIWNVAVLVILIAVNLKYDWFYLRTVLLALIIGGLGIGTNLHSNRRACLFRSKSTRYPWSRVCWRNC